MVPGEMSAAIAPDEAADLIHGQRATSEEMNAPGNGFVQNE